MSPDPPARSSVEISPAKPLRIAQVGLGAIGKACCRLAAGKRGLALVGAADISPEINGKDLSSILGTEFPEPLTVYGSISELIRETGPEVILLTTGSRCETVLPQLEEILSLGVSCVTSAEEILIADYRNPEAAARLQEIAERHRTAVVGTGVNPGFVMDLLAILMTGVCERVDALRAGRKVDLATRRKALQKKAGVGMTVEEFRQQVDAGRMGHVGLMESAALICRCLGWDEGELIETINPLTAEKEIAMAGWRVPKGRVLGLRHTVGLKRNWQELLRLDLQMSLGAKDPADWVEIDGRPELKLGIPGGVPGDWATAALLVHTSPSIFAAPPGLHTILDLPPVRFVP